MTQLTREDLKTMSPTEIDAAHNEGRLDLALGLDSDYVELVERASGVITSEDIAALRRAGREDLIVKAHDEDRITHQRQGINA